MTRGDAVYDIRIEWHVGEGEWELLSSVTVNHREYLHQVVSKLRSGGTPAMVALMPNTTYHYRAQIRNSFGWSEWSDEIWVTTMPMPDPEPFDATREGRVTADDGYVNFHLLRLPADVDVRQTILGPYLPEGVVVTDENIAEHLGSPEQDMADINGDGDANEVDAVLVNNIRAFQELVGDGSFGSGFREDREIFIGPYPAAGVNRTVDEMRRMIRVVRGLR